MNKNQKNFNVRNDKFKYVFSASFLIMAVLIIFFDWFKERIDSTVIVLVIIAYFPWLTKYIKSFEGFGIKTELVENQKKEQIDKDINELNNKSKKLDKNLINTNITIDKREPIGSKKNPILIESMEVIARTSNPIEKMVLIRYEIEKELKILCRVNNIQSYQRTIRQMIEELRKNNMLDNKAANLLLDIIPILNKAVHLDINNINYNDLEWVIEKGSALVMHLEIITKDPSKYKLISLD